MIRLGESVLLFLRTTKKYGDPLSNSLNPISVNSMTQIWSNFLLLTAAGTVPQWIVVKNGKERYLTPKFNRLSVSMKIPLFWDYQRE